MSEEIGLSAAINNAVSEWCGKNDKSVLLNFVFVAEFIEEDGCRSSSVCTPPDSPISSSLGLSVYAKNFFTECQRRDILGVVYTDGECGCEGDDD